MNRKEALALKEDRDYWKKLCKELSDKNIQLETELNLLTDVINGSQYSDEIWDEYNHAKKLI